MILDAQGGRVEDEETLARVRSLAIPPAWREVWICRDALGHLQATGIDAAGRKQYRYHDRWRARRDAQKFEAMLEFARTLPTLRRRVQRDLKRDELGRERVLACATRLLDLGVLPDRRRGLRRAERELRPGDDPAPPRAPRSPRASVFDYEAKSGQRRVHVIADPDVRRVIEPLKRRRGGRPDLLAYKVGRRWVDVRSDDVNEYVKEASGDATFTAKDFRTWNATVLAATAIATTGPDAASRRARTRAVSAAVRHVADYLGNTPAVARSSYIDPRVFDRYLSGWTIGGAIDEVGGKADLGQPLIRARIEEAVLDLIEDERESPALEKVA